MRSAILAVLCGFLLVAGACRPMSLGPVTPPAVSFWYWHTPFVLSPTEVKTLQQIGVQELFVRAATLAYSNDTNAPVQRTLPQTWKMAAPVPVHLVFPVHASLVRRLESLSEEALAHGIVTAIRAEENRAIAAHLTVAGAQIDLDCPTRLLPRYASLLKRIKQGSGLPLSITLLTSWYSGRDLAAVLDAVDFSVPQFYEGETQSTRDQFRPISDLRRFERGLKSAERLGRPYYVGVPTYGHAPVYDGSGKLRGLFHDASAADLLNRPQEFRLLSIAPLDRQGQSAAKPEDFIGEEMVEFGPVRTMTAFRLLYDLPTPVLLEKHLATYARVAPPHCRGMILYRLPQGGEESVLPLVTVASVLGRKQPTPQLSFVLRTRRRSPYELIEVANPKEVTPLHDLYLTLTNTGDGGVRVAPRSMSVTLYFSRPALEAVRSGAFEEWEAFRTTPDNRSSVVRADGLRFFTTHFAPGERRVFGPITLRPGAPLSVRGEWTAVCPGGYTTIKGTLPLSSVALSERLP